MSWPGNMYSRALIERLRKLIAAEEHVGTFRIATKRNTKGELVIAIIVPEQGGPLGRDAMGDD